MADGIVGYRKTAQTAPNPPLRRRHTVINIRCCVHHDPAGFGQAVFGLQPDQPSRQAVLAHLGITRQKAALARSI